MKGALPVDHGTGCRQREWQQRDPAWGRSAETSGWDSKFKLVLDSGKKNKRKWPRPLSTSERNWQEEGIQAVRQL